MTQNDAIARAIAYFETCDDAALLKDLIRSIQPRAAAEVRRAQQQGRPVAPPLEIAAAPAAATQDEALVTVKTTTSFAQLQAMSRAIGRRIESLGG